MPPGKSPRKPSASLVAAEEERKEDGAGGCSYEPWYGQEPANQRITHRKYTQLGVVLEEGEGRRGKEREKGEGREEGREKKWDKRREKRVGERMGGE